MMLKYGVALCCGWIAFLLSTPSWRPGSEVPYCPRGHAIANNKCVIRLPLREASAGRDLVALTMEEVIQSLSAGEVFDGTLVERLGRPLESAILNNSENLFPTFVGPMVLVRRLDDLVEGAIFTITDGPECVVARFLSAEEVSAHLRAFLPISKPHYFVEQPQASYRVEPKA